MEIKILASESMGVRSMATFIQTEDVNILIDPSCALSPRRFGLPPHSLELKQRKVRLKTINSHLKTADIVIITHYHYDHFTEENAGLYHNKILLIKDPYRFSHEGLKKRAERFLNKLPTMKDISIADGRHYVFGKTEIIFSPPLHHGTYQSKVFVVSVCIITEDITFLHSSDIQGINTEIQLAFIEKCSPDIAFLDGFPIYLIDKYYTQEDFSLSIKLLQRAYGHIKTLILDHHIARIKTFRDFFHEGIEFVTAAEFMHDRELLLEAQRKELYAL